MPWLRKNSYWILIFLGTLTWSLTMIKSGLVYDYGMGFWGPNGHDGIWHVTLINSLSRGSLDMPIFAGEQIKNYHLGFDLVLAALHRATGISSISLYFQITPPLLAFLIGFLTYKLTRNTWSIFFVYFGGSLGWLLGKGESAFWSQQSISTLINPPFALSLILLLLLLLLLKKDRYILAGLVLAFLPHVKIYAGLLAFLGLFLAGFKNKNLFKTLITGLLVYLPSNYQLLTNNSRLLVWSPGWFLETMMGLSDRLNWPDFSSALDTYKVSHNFLKGVPAYLLAFVIFWVGNMGTRLIKEILVFKWLKDIRKISWIEYFYASVIIVGGIIPMFFLQSGTPWNTIQFFYYSLFFSSILVGLSMSEILLKIKNLKLKIIVSSLVIIITIPTAIDTLTKVYLPSRPPAKISSEELNALEFLSRQPPGVVLTYPVIVDPYAPPPRPLYLYESTAYVSALSGQPTYLEDEVNLNITGYDWPTRRKSIEKLFTSDDSQFAQKFLIFNNISYIYLARVAKNRPVLSETQLGFIKLFENSESSVWGRVL